MLNPEVKKRYAFLSTLTVGRWRYRKRYKYKPPRSVAVSEWH